MKDETYILETEKNEIVPAGAVSAEEKQIKSLEGVGYQDAIWLIKDELKKTGQSCLKIGFFLNHIKEKKMYREEGYANIYEFSEEKFHLKQPSVSNFINLYRQFAAPDNSLELAKEYKPFGISQLFEMIPMKPEERAEITPDMSVRDIREYKAEIKKKEAEEREKKDFGLAGADKPEEEYQTSDKDEVADIIPGKKKNQPALSKIRTDGYWIGWLENVEKWGLWYEDPNIHARYYKYDFPDGSRLVAVKYRYTCPPYMREKPENYKKQIRADGSYYGDPVYHLTYSDTFWEMYPDECRKDYKKYYSHETLSADELMPFLQWFDMWQENDRYWRTVEFDTNHLDEKSNKEHFAWNRKYMEFYEKKGYIPRYFNIKNCSELKGDGPASTITTSSGGFNGGGSITTFDLWQNIQFILKNKLIGRDVQESEISKLMRIASPSEQENVKQQFESISNLWQDIWEVVNENAHDIDALEGELRNIIQGINPVEEDVIKMKYTRILHFRRDINRISRMSDAGMQEREYAKIRQAAIPEEIECIQQQFDAVSVWNAAHRLWETDYELWKAASEKAKEKGFKIGRVKFRIKKLTEADCSNLMGVQFTEEDIRKLKEKGVNSTTLYQVAGEGVPVPMSKAFLEMIGKG